MLAVVLLVGDGDKILLRKRKKEPDQGKWELFGSYVKEGETLLQAAKRVLVKKAQVNTESMPHFTGKFYDALERHPGKRCVPLVYKVYIDKDKVQETEELKWFSLGEISGLGLALDNKQIILEN